MKKNLRTLILTLSIVAATGIGSTAYAQGFSATNYTVKSGDSVQQICAKYGVKAPESLTEAECLAAVKDLTAADLSAVKAELSAVKAEATKTKKTPRKKVQTKTETKKATTTCNAAPVKETPVKETPVKETPVKETPVKETPVKETPVKETPVKETPVKEAPVKKAPVKEAPVKEAPVEVTPAKATTAPALTGDAKIESEVVTLVNQERAKLGLAPLKNNIDLSNVARTKSKDMATNNYFSHTSPTYGSPFDMMKKFGITYSYAGENIAMGQPTAASVMEGWMNSPGHKANILSENFTEIGVGIATDENGSIYWTQQFIGK
jgi:uncharacterized YkwD family protein